jgi:hypothetical protein
MVSGTSAARPAAPLRKSMGLVAAGTRTEHRFGRSSHALEHLQHDGQRFADDPRRHANDGVLQGNLDLNLTEAGGCRLRCVRADNNRGKGQRTNASPSPDLTPPSEQVLGRHAMTTNDLGHHRARRYRLPLLRNPRLLIRRPAASTGSSDHFQAPQGSRQHKYVVKH